MRLTLLLTLLPLGGAVDSANWNNSRNNTKYLN
jgi:hypothetical protein